MKKVACLTFSVPAHTDSHILYCDRRRRRWLNDDAALPDFIKVMPRVVAFPDVVLWLTDAKLNG